MSTNTIEIVIRTRMDEQGGRGLSALQSSLGRIAEFAIGGIVTRGIAAITSGIGQLWTNAIGAASEMQNLSIALEGLVAREMTSTGETDNLAEAIGQAGPKAEELMNWLRKLSVQSPFQYSQIADVFRFTMAMGATSEMAKAMTESITNLASGMGLTGEALNRMSYNLSQAIVQGDLTEANLRQLKLVGIDLAGILEKQLGMSIDDIRKKMDAGELSAKDLADAFNRYVTENFSGAANRMSRTLSGLQSSFKDLFFFAGADLLTPAIETVSGALGGVFDKLSGMMEGGAFKAIGEQIGKFAEKGIAFAEALFTTGANSEETKAKLADIFGEETPIAKGIMALFEGVGKLGQAFQEIASDPIFQEYAKEIGDFIVEKLIPGVLELAGWLTGELADGIKAVAGFIKDPLVPALQEAYKWFAENLLPVLKDIWEWLSENIPPAIQVLADFWTGVLAPALEDAWGIIRPILEKLWEFLTTKIPEAVGKLRAWWESDWMGIKTMFDGFLKHLLIVFDIFKEAMQGDWYEFGESLRMLVDNFMETVKGVFEERVQDIMALFLGLAEKIKTIDWLQLGINIVQGIGEGMMSMADWLSQTLMDLAGGALEALRGFLGIHSPSDVFADVIGKNITLGIAEGMRNMAGSLGGAALQVAAAPVYAMATVGYSGGGGGGNRNVVVNINAPIMGFQDTYSLGQQLAPIIDEHLRKRG